VQRLIDAAMAEANRTRATLKRDLEEFREKIGDRVLHANSHVFDVLESLQLDHDLKYNDKLILSCVLEAARRIKADAPIPMFFCSSDRVAFDPSNHPRLALRYKDAHLEFRQDFQLPELSGSSAS
jgi:hypothetical protein